MIDATANEIPNQSIRGYPTLLLFPAKAAEGESHEFSGERKSEAMIEWLKARATNGRSLVPDQKISRGDDDDEGLLSARKRKPVSLGQRSSTAPPTVVQEELLPSDYNAGSGRSDEM